MGRIRAEGPPCLGSLCEQLLKQMGMTQLETGRGQKGSDLVGSLVEAVGESTVSREELYIEES